MFTDERRCKVWEQVRQHDLRAFAKLLPRVVFGEAGEAAGTRLGKSALWLPSLVMLALGAARRNARRKATSRKGKGRKGKGRDGKGGKAKRSKHDPRGGDPTKVTEEAFVQARRRMPLAFWTALLMILVGRFGRGHGAWFWSYALFWQIQKQGAYFAIRKYPGVRFKTIERFGPKDRLVEWTPSNPAQRRDLPEVIRLRVIDYQIKGFRPSAVVTNVESIPCGSASNTPWANCWTCSPR